MLRYISNNECSYPQLATGIMIMPSYLKIVSIKGYTKCHYWNLYDDALQHYIWKLDKITIHKGKNRNCFYMFNGTKRTKLGINEVPISTIQALLQDKINEGKHLSRISIYLLFVYVCDSLMIEGGLWEEFLSYGTNLVTINPESHLYVVGYEWFSKQDWRFIYVWICIYFWRSVGLYPRLTC